MDKALDLLQLRPQKQQTVTVLPPVGLVVTQQGVKQPHQPTPKANVTQAKVRSAWVLGYPKDRKLLSRYAIEALNSCVSKHSLGVVVCQ